MREYRWQTDRARGQQLVKSWPITVFLVCLFAAMAAPGPDAMSMFYLFGPLLFFAAITVCLLNDRRRDRRAAETEATADQATPSSELENL